MKYCHIPAFPAIAPIFRTALCTTAEFRSTCKKFETKVMRSGLFLLLLFTCLLLFHGSTIPHVYASGMELISSDFSGVLLELKVDDLAAENKEFNGGIYHLISYRGCGFTSEAGKPQLPVSQAFLGVPPSASISVSVIDSQYSDLRGYVPLPVPEKIQRTSPGGMDALVEELAIDSEFYRRNVLYPSGNAALAYEGYVRRQRVAVIELRPVQYNPVAKILRKYSRLVVRVNFSSSTGYDPSMLAPGAVRATDVSDKEFEKLYQGLILNYEDARKYRKMRTLAAPAKQDAEMKSEAFKIFVARSGIYRLDYAMLHGAGIDLSEVDPRTIKIRIQGDQVPIYVKGEADGAFDEEDYLEFMGAKPESIYTLWNVYWLTWGGSRGMRMFQKNGTPKARLAREVTSFKSVQRFGEDHLHHKLQNVNPDPDDPEAWFESRDHWFWDGIENGSAKNEVTVEFPVYDLAQAMVRPDFRIELVGCTNYEHNIMISVNGYRVGNEAEWNSQDVYSFDGQIPANALKNGINELRLTRIGKNAADGQNTMSYPYQIYLNWFEIGYLRELLAVNDSLEFSAPAPEDPGVEETNRYEITGFLSDDVEIFQIADSNAVCKLTGVEVESYALDRDDRDRMRAVNSIFGGSGIQNTAYRAIFEDQDRYSPQYIAVTSASVLEPDRIERDASSDLKSPSNRADYIIISHPMFIDAANQLADWRSGARGGGFRTKVVDVTDIYDEFGSGMVSPHAIKDFLRYAYNNWAEPAPAYVLIFADATYDFLGINEEFYEETPELIGFVPTFYFFTTFGQTAVDHWYSTIDGDDGFPDIYLGRIPVESTSEAEAALEKIIANESGQVNGPWRKQIISIADDDSYAAGDEIFQIGLEEIWRDHTPPGYDTEKIYLKNIIQQVEQDPLETRRPASITQDEIIDAFSRGAVIAQYSGHGGRHVWAHEIIFSITDIDDFMKEAEVYPFLLVLSCYNGYFDLPGEICMAEGMVRAKRKGSVAMLSATRLTYGAGNVALNKFLFDSIFKEGMLRIGQVTASSKIRVMVEEGMSWLAQMREYTLFGDPASRLNIPDYEIRPQIKNSTVTPSGTLDVLAGQVVTLVDSQPGSFDGEMTVKASFPDGRESSKTVAVVKGGYPAVSLDVPAGMSGGQGSLTCFGQNTIEAVVGGAKFSVSEPSLLSVSHEFAGDELQFYAEVNDDAGPSGIKSINLNWSSPDNRGGTDSPMIFDPQKNVYKLAQAIPVSLKGGELTYKIEIEDVDGNVVTIQGQPVILPSRPNLTIFSPLDASEPGISYGYSPELQMLGVDVRVYNGGAAEMPCSVQLVAFGGNPDRDQNRVVDENAQALGQVKINPEDWNDDGTYSAFIPFSLPTGVHTVFVWIDPESNADHPNDVFGACAEGNESDNVSSRTLDITHVLLKPGKEAETRSLDNMLHFSAPAGAVSRNQVIAVEPVQEVQKPLNQPDVSFVTLADDRQSGYMVGDPANDSYRMEFIEPVSIQMKFDLASFQELVNLSEDQVGSREDLERALKERAADLAIYIWCESARKWAQMPSEPVLDDSSNILTEIHNTVPVRAGAGDEEYGYIADEWTRNFSIDEGAEPPVDNWSIIFIDPQHFRVEGSETGVLMKNNEPYVGTVGEEFYDQDTGFRFTITLGTDAFAEGDRFEFRTVEAGTIQASAGSSGVFTLMLNQDDSPPRVQIEVADQNFADGDVVSPEPNIQAFISDENGVDVLTRRLDISISRDGEEFEPAGEDDYVFHWDAVSNEVPVNYWPGKLEPGEYEVRFRTYDFNGNSGSNSVKFIVKREFELGKDSLMNYPNPFERETDITFHLTSVADEAIIKIYTVSGRLIRTLEQKYPVNFVVIHWDGRDEDGKEVANGVYYYRVRLTREGTKDIVEIGKMMKLK